MKKFYIHTIGGIPARYYKGEQICFSRRIPLQVLDIKRIRREQRLSNKWRREKGFTENTDYGYVCVFVK